MKTLPHLFMSVLAAALMLAFADHAVMAQEKAKAEKAKTELKTKAKERAPAPVLFENDRVRVIETRIKPGERNAMQERSDRVIYHFNAGKAKVHYPDGKTEEREFKAGTVEFRKRDTTSSENIGKTENHNLNVNLK
jgi:hypothetical protein